MDYGSYQNDVDLLKDLELYTYENIFRAYKTGPKDFLYYNILKKIDIPDNINETLFEYIEIPSSLPLTTLSFRIYGTTYLWWLIMIVNKIDNPAKIESGKKIKFIKKPFLRTVLEGIKAQLR